MESLAILGSFLACLNMLTSGISNLVNTADAWRTFEQQRLDFGLRYARCQSDLRDWEIKWSQRPSSGQVNHMVEVAPALRDIKLLTMDIYCRIWEAEKSTDRAQREVTGEQNRPAVDSSRWVRRSREVTAPLQERWAKWQIKRKGVITERAMHALFNKGLMEGWLARLEKAVADLEKSSERKLEERTGANLVKRARGEEVKDAENFMSTLKSSAESLHRECTEEFSTGDWMLGLRSPQRHGSVAEWKYLVDIHFELRFRHGAPSVRDIWELKTRCEIEDEDTHDFRGKLRPILPMTNQECAPGSRTVKDITCIRQAASIKRTGSIGNLLTKNPRYFDAESWKAGVADHVHSIVNWAILLWDTKWFESLCCFGLYMESSQTTNHCMMLVGDCRCTTDHRLRRVPRRLQNLGITIAQIVLAKPLRVVDHVSGTKFQEQDEDGKWKDFRPRQLVRAIVEKSDSLGLADAIKFCLTDSEWVRNGFREAYLMEFINSIYIP